MKEWLIRRIKKAGGNIESTLTNIFFLALFGGSVAILAFSKKALSFVLQIAEIPTPLWATILLVLMCFLYIYLKIQLYQNSQNPPNIQEELYEEYGVNWNKEYKKRCLYCKSPLKYASDKYGPSVFFCSKCDRKHVLRDTNGNLITEQKAIEKLKNANQRVNLTP